MIRRFNYTGRKRIGHENCHIMLSSDNGAAAFDANINLTSYALPPESRLYVEAYRQTTWMRFDFGTVSDFAPPSDRRLSEFESIEDILFRVRVVSEGTTHGKLLAEADKIRLRQPVEHEDFRRPLLPVISKQLRGIISRVDFEDRPRLEINTEIGNWRELAGNPAFRSMVLSYAIREILARILRIERYSETDDDTDDWRSQWLRYASSLPGAGDPPSEGADESRIDDWIDTAVSAFGVKFKVMESFNTFWQDESA